jgi:monoamine oxidase
MAKDASVVIIGAGASGLTAAAELARAGVNVTIVEARDRIGGRMFTQKDPHTGAVVELGAEFIHGRPPQIWDLLRKNKIHAHAVDGDNYCVQKEKLSDCDFFSQIDEVLEKLTDRGRDQSFIEFLRKYEKKKLIPPAIRARVLRYIQGFHAADPRLISVHSLVKGMRADEKIDGEQAYRIPQGYQRLLKIFQTQIKGVQLDLNTVVKQIHWKQSHAQITTNKKTYEATHALITLPLGVLQAKTKSKGAVQFSPRLPAQKRQALSKLAMGKVIRVSLCFRERFWEDLRVNKKSLSKLSFLFSDDELFPTWWTQMPTKSPVIVGWAPFHAADQLTGHSLDSITNKALRALSNLLHTDHHKLKTLLAASHSHDWETDPFSRGAYSYVKFGGDTAQKNLGKPLANTLFFAGEATDITGYNGTVHGAMASGHRAASEILRAIG